MLEGILEEIIRKKYSALLISTTAKTSENILRLPNKEFRNNMFANILINSESALENLLTAIDGIVDTVLVDVESKQDIDMYAIAQNTLNISRIIPYKPNDITLEAADQLVSKCLNNNFSNKKILIVGTGNLAFKISLRLIERGAEIIIWGRDERKVGVLTECLNIIKPKYSRSSASPYKKSISECDGLISFVSSDKVIDESFTSLLKEEGVAIDGGIGNFNERFINDCLLKQISLFRLDVRLGNLFLLASKESYESDNGFFENVIGTRSIDNIDLVAGGIIGRNGAIIVDKIKKPTQVIGMANGYGGVKSVGELTEVDKEKLDYAKEKFLQYI